MPRATPLKQLALGIAGAAIVALGVVSVWVERESDYTLGRLGGAGEARALVLYHPSRDAHFSDELSLAVARGFLKAGLAVDRATTTSATPDRPTGYAVVAVIGNTYYWTPDLPTQRYLRRARFDGLPVLGIMGGAGATGRSERMLDEALRRAGGSIVATRSYWLLRPNDEARIDEPNRARALQNAEALALEVGQRVVEDRSWR
jgi:hypothetical protein